MRLSSPFPFISREAREDTAIGGRYAVRRGEQIALMLSVLHSDPEVYGAGAAAEFRPERMLDGAFDRGSCARPRTPGCPSAPAPAPASAVSSLGK